MASGFFLSSLFISFYAVFVHSVLPAANLNTSHSANRTITAINVTLHDSSHRSDHNSLRRSDPEELVRSANEAQSCFKNAYDKLQKVKADMKQSQAKPQNLKEKKKDLEEEVASSKNEVAFQSAEVAAQRETLNGLEQRMKNKQQTIESLRRELAEKQASIAVRKERLAKKRQEIEEKRADLQELKNSIGSLDTWRVEREEEELRKAIQENNEETRDLEWDEATTRDRSAHLRTASNHWQQGQALIDDAEARLRHAEDTLAYRLRMLKSQESLLLDLQQKLTTQMKEDNELRAALDSASWEAEAAAHSVIARQGSAIGALKSYAKDLADKSNEQQEKLSKAALENAKKDAAVQSEIAHGVQKDLVIDGIKSAVENHKAQLKQAEHDSIVAEGQKAALHKEDARQAVEVHRLRGENAAKRALNDQLANDAARAHHNAVTAQKSAAAQEARGRHAWYDMKHAAARNDAAEDELERAIASNEYAHDGLARRDYVIHSQNEDLWRQDAALDHAHSERVRHEARNDALSDDAADKDRTSGFLDDAIARRDEVMKMQADEIKKQEQDIESNDKLAASKSAVEDSLRDEDANKDKMLKSLRGALDSQEDAMKALEETLQATRLELQKCDDKGTPDHLADKLGDFVDALRKSKTP